MTLFEKRMDEFVDYHINGDGECNGIVLRRYADKAQIPQHLRIDLAFMFSVVYCVESAIVLFRNRDEIVKTPKEWAAENKGRLVFQSDRKYIKMKDAFSACMQFYSNNFQKIREILGCERRGEKCVIDLKRLIPAVERWPYFGRFSAYLFLETVAQLVDSEVINASMEWENGATATSGLLNLYGFDAEADAFDRSRKLPDQFPPETLQILVEPVLAEIASRGGNNNITMVETSLCAYRKFFKRSRYNGYYLDRMLEEILFMQKDFPEISAELLEIRRSAFNNKYLGEVGGWRGIRKECKKSYMDTGRVM